MCFHCGTRGGIHLYLGTAGAGTVTRRWKWWRQVDKVEKIDLCDTTVSFLFGYFCSPSFIVFLLCNLFPSVLSCFLSYFGTPIFRHALGPRLILIPVPLSPFIRLPLLTQLGLMEQWPNDKDPGEQTHLDLPPAATRDTYTPPTLLLSI